MVVVHRALLTVSVATAGLLAFGARARRAGAGWDGKE
jgi:hypothetical protein